jgi:hypothetical protein
VSDGEAAMLEVVMKVRVDVERCESNAMCLGLAPAR